MILLSTKRNSDRGQIVCENGIFDPSLASIISVDATEKYIMIAYDFDECGHPLNLPFNAGRVEFGVKFTPNDIHICAIVEPDGEDSSLFEEFSNSVGEYEFDVRMSTEEKLRLNTFVIYTLMNEKKFDGCA